MEDVLYLRLEINGKLKRWTYTINWYQISLGRTILMCFARYTFIFLCKPVIIDTYTMIMDNSIIKFVRYDVIQLPGETIKEWYWHLILFVMHERQTLFFTKMNLYFFGLLGFWLLYRTGKSDLHCISLNIDAWLYIQKRKACFSVHWVLKS